MQHATPDAYEREAERFDDMAASLEARGATYKARQYREMARDCRERASQVRNGK